MTVITMTDAMAIGGLSISQVRYDMVEASDATGDEAVRLFGPPRWRIELRPPESVSLEAAEAWHAALLKLRGSINVLAAYDAVRPEPRGTMRDPVVLNVAVSAGATSLQLRKAVGTLRPGDWIGIGQGLGTSQLVQVVDAAASSVLTPTTPTWTTGGAPCTWTTGGQPCTWSISGYCDVIFEPPLRAGYAADTAVVLTRPLAYFRAAGGSSIGWTYQNRWFEGGLAFDGLETFA